MFVLAVILYTVASFTYVGSECNFSGVCKFVRCNWVYDRYPVSNTWFAAAVNGKVARSAMLATPVQRHTRPMGNTGEAPDAVIATPPPLPVLVKHCSNPSYYSRRTELYPVCGSLRHITVFH